MSKNCGGEMWQHVVYDNIPYIDEDGDSCDQSQLSVVHTNHCSSSSLTIEDVTLTFADKCSSVTAPVEDSGSIPDVVCHALDRTEPTTPSLCKQNKTSGLTKLRKLCSFRRFRISNILKNSRSAEDIAKARGRSKFYTTSSLDAELVDCTSVCNGDEEDVVRVNGNEARSEGDARREVPLQRGVRTTLDDGRLKDAENDRSITAAVCGVNGDVRCRRDGGGVGRGVSRGHTEKTPKCGVVGVKKRPCDSGPDVENNNCECLNKPLRAGSHECQRDPRYKGINGHYDLRLTNVGQPKNDDNVQVKLVNNTGHVQSRDSDHARITNTHMNGNVAPETVEVRSANVKRDKGSGTLRAINPPGSDTRGRGTNPACLYGDKPRNHGQFEDRACAKAPDDWSHVESRIENMNEYSVEQRRRSDTGGFDNSRRDNYWSDNDRSDSDRSYNKGCDNSRCDDSKSDNSRSNRLSKLDNSSTSHNELGETSNIGPDSSLRCLESSSPDQSNDRHNVNGRLCLAACNPDGFNIAITGLTEDTLIDTAASCITPCDTSLPDATQSPRGFINVAPETMAVQDDDLSDHSPDGNLPGYPYGNIPEVCDSDLNNCAQVTLPEYSHFNPPDHCDKRHRDLSVNNRFDRCRDDLNILVHDTADVCADRASISVNSFADYSPDDFALSDMIQGAMSRTHVTSTFCNFHNSLSPCPTALQHAHEDCDFIETDIPETFRDSSCNGSFSSTSSINGETNEENETRCPLSAAEPNGSVVSPGDDDASALILTRRLRCCSRSSESLDDGCQDLNETLQPLSDAERVSPSFNPRTSGDIDDVDDGYLGEDYDPGVADAQRSLYSLPRDDEASACPRTESLACSTAPSVNLSEYMIHAGSIRATPGKYTPDDEYAPPTNYPPGNIHADTSARHKTDPHITLETTERSQCSVTITTPTTDDALYATASFVPPRSHSWSSSIPAQTSSDSDFSALVFSDSPLVSPDFDVPVSARCPNSVFHSPTYDRPPPPCSRVRRSFDAFNQDPDSSCDTVTVSDGMSRSHEHDSINWDDMIVDFRSRDLSYPTGNLETDTAVANFAESERRGYGNFHDDNQHGRFNFVGESTSFVDQTSNNLDVDLAGRQNHSPDITDGVPSVSNTDNTEVIPVYCDDDVNGGAAGHMVDLSLSNYLRQGTHHRRSANDLDFESHLSTPGDCYCMLSSGNCYCMSAPTDCYCLSASSQEPCCSCNSNDCTTNLFYSNVPPFYWSNVAEHATDLNEGLGGLRYPRSVALLGYNHGVARRMEAGACEGWTPQMAHSAGSLSLSNTQLSLEKGSNTPGVAMIWSDYEAVLIHAKQISPSACGPTAVINVLKALGRPLTKERVCEVICVKLRHEAAPLPEYLFSRSVAGTTVEELIRGTTRLTEGAVVGRFFHFYPQRSVNILHWLTEWIKRGAVPIATLNLQKEVASRGTTPDAWHHQMIYGVDMAKGAYVTNPLGVIPESTLHAQLCSESVLLVRRQDVVTRFDTNSDLTKLLSLAGPTWHVSNVLGQVVNVLREESWPRCHGYRTQVTSHIEIPMAYKAGISLFVKANTDEHAQLMAAQELRREC